MSARHEDAPLEAPMVGDHLAMDLLNTEVRSHGHPVDTWRSGEDVLGWLAQQGIALPEGVGPVGTGELLARGRALRRAVRDAVIARKAGEVPDVEGLNAFLQAHPTSLQLGHEDDGRLSLGRVARGDAIGSLLGPVAEAAAQLLVDGDFALVRQCEHPDCVLWFYDRTKSHKRRWCSMALCGNRHKASRFRNKSGGGSSDRAPPVSRSDDGA